MGNDREDNIMRLKGEKLIFISSIKRDGSGIVNLEHLDIHRKWV